MLSLSFLSAIGFAPAPGSPAGDEIKALPGWEGPLPSKMFSGYVNVTAATDREMLVHYFYVESEGNPDTDPTILWTNGGPGASSMFGLFVELGPFLTNDDSLTTATYNQTGVPSLFYNPYGWSRLGSVLMKLGVTA